MPSGCCIWGIDTIVVCDQAEGIRWYHRAAEAGSDAAMSRLAQIYEADKHYAEGIRWYHRAAEAGSDAAMSRLAQIYEADKHYKEAARWYRRYAADRIRWRNQRMNW